MIWNYLKYHLTHECHCTTEKSLRREIKRWWNSHISNFPYYNAKYDHLYKVVDQVLAFTGLN
jgi:hypothetical protein